MAASPSFGGPKVTQGPRAGFPLSPYDPHDDKAAPFYPLAQADGRRLRFPPFPPSYANRAPPLFLLTCQRAGGAPSPPSLGDRSSPHALGMVVGPSLLSFSERIIGGQLLAQGRARGRRKRLDLASSLLLRDEK